MPAWSECEPTKGESALMTNHKSDCAVHNEPAMKAGPCDCGVMTLTDEQLAAIETRLEAATPGPWSFVWAHSAGLVAKGDYPPHDITSRNLGPFEWVIDGDAKDDDLIFIAHAPTDIRALLDEVERLRAYIREITTTKPANKPTFDAGPYWGPSGGSHD